MAAVFAYALTDSLAAVLAIGLVVGLLGWLAVSLIPEFLAVISGTSKGRG
jgi:hypothetical protein